MKLTSENVESVILDCLFRPGEDTSTAVIGEGVMSRMGFHPERLRKNSEDIFSMLTSLPGEFMETEGGGYTFLNACNDSTGEQWTGEHAQVDKLIILGSAIGRVRFPMPREMWTYLPGGVPYFTVLNKERVAI